MISTAIPEVEVLGGCRIGRDPDEFVAQIEAALADPGPSRSRSDAVRHESWEARLNEIKPYIAAALTGRESTSPDMPIPQLAA